MALFFFLICNPSFPGNEKGLICCQVVPPSPKPSFDFGETIFGATFTHCPQTSLSAKNASRAAKMKHENRRMRMERKQAADIVRSAKKSIPNSLRTFFPKLLFHKAVLQS